MTRTCLTFSALKCGLKNISGFCSPIPTIGTGGAFFAAAAGAATTTASTHAIRRAIRTSVRLGEDGVLVGVGRRAAAQEHERLCTRVEQLVTRPGRDHDRVAR